MCACLPTGIKYEDQNWYKLELPMYKRSPVAALQRLAVLAPLLDNATDAEVCAATTSPAEQHPSSVHVLPPILTLCIQR